MRILFAVFAVASMSLALFLFFTGDFDRANWFLIMAAIMRYEMDH